MLRKTEQYFEILDTQCMQLKVTLC